MKDKKSHKEIIIQIFFIIFASITIVTGIMIFKWAKENKKSNDIIVDIKDTVSVDEYNETEENTENKDKYTVNFEELKQTNSDTIAWIKVNGTNIEYPVVKTTDNDYYLTHSFDKSSNSAGWVFMDYENRFDGTDSNMVLYAHNRRDGSLFGTLNNILTNEWQSNTENFTIPFITEKEKAEYQVFSVYKIENEDYYITTSFETDNEFQKFIDTIKSRSIKDFNVDVTTEDHILTLSTCADNNKYRVVLHAKRVN
ncbi:MAG: class B sortase [Lachnospiraceae bacterium]|nr:class B sortase [Lachnospiraceae bacterium]